MTASEDIIKPTELTKEDAIKLVTLVEKHPLIPSEKWYLVSLSWWKTFMSAYDDEIPFKDVPPIDNTSILDIEGTRRLLKPNLIERLNYILVPEIAFRVLLKYFDIRNGDRDIIERTVVSRNSLMRDVRVEVYPFIIKIAKSDSLNDVVTLTISANDTFDAVKSRALDALDIAQESRVQCYRKDNGKYEKLVINSGFKWEEVFTYNELVVIDVVDENGTGVISNNAPRSLFGRSSAYSLNGDWGFSTNRAAAVTIYKPGVVGMQNLGNTCFMNSALQCLCNVPELKDFFYSGHYLHDLNEDNVLGMQGQLASVYAELVEQVWSGELDIVLPRRFKTVIGQFAPRFSGYSQQDAQEMLSFLLDGLHEDLNRIKNKPYIEEKEADGRPDNIVAEEAWQNYLKRNDSIIVDNIHGQLKSTVVCPVCHKVSVKFDPFCFLSVPLPTKDKITKTTVVFIPSTQGRNWARFSVTLPRSAQVWQVKQLLRTHLNLGQSTLIFALVARNEVDKVMDDNDQVLDSAHPNGRQIFAWELDCAITDVPHIIHIRNKAAMISRPVTLPMFMAMSKTQKLTKEFIKEFIVPRICKQFIAMENGSELEEESIENANPNAPSNDQGTVESLCQIEYSDYLDTENLINFTNGQVELSPPDRLGFRGITLTFTWDTNIFKDYQGEDLIERDVAVPAHALKFSSSLYDCIDTFTTVEMLNDSNLWYCSNCKKHQKATKKLDIWKLPRILIIHLKRFQFNRWCREKVDSLVSVPVKNLNLNSKVLSGDRNNIYNLIAISNHFGGLGGGHYTAWALKDDDWYDLNDSLVSCLGDLGESYVSRDAYMLFYRRCSQNVLMSRAEPNIEMETDD